MKDSQTKRSRGFGFVTFKKVFMVSFLNGFYSDVGDTDDDANHNVINNNFFDQTHSFDHCANCPICCRSSACPVRKSNLGNTSSSRGQERNKNKLKTTTLELKYHFLCRSTKQWRKDRTNLTEGRSLQRELYLERSVDLLPVFLEFAFSYYYLYTCTGFWKTRSPCNCEENLCWWNQRRYNRRRFEKIFWKIWTCWNCRGLQNLNLGIDKNRVSWWIG